MNEKALEALGQLGVSAVKGDLDKYFDALFVSLRVYFVFDNVAIYKTEREGNLIEAVYARAVGRGRSKGADASWGEEMANQVIASGRIQTDDVNRPDVSDRTQSPHRLGLPLELLSGRGALVFVRFGGPAFTEEQLPFALLAASRVAFGFEQVALAGALSQLDLARHRAQLQDDFIATISHEVHTPLGFIKGYTTSLLRTDTTWDAVTQREFLTIIDEETDNLIRLIDRMLDSARLKTGSLSMDFQPVRLDAIIRDVALRFQERYPDLKIVLDLENTRPIQADSVRLSQVFTNLFENAIKYAPGSPIEITLRQRHQFQEVVFSDSGPGIPPQHIPFIFERFYRVENKGPLRGTGLGLFICKQIIQAHGGQIFARSVPNRGSSFYITLPLNAERNVER